MRHRPELREASTSEENLKQKKGMNGKGYPAWDLKAEQVLNGIREWVKKGGDAGEVAFDDFLQVLDAFLSQLIEWTEQKDSIELREWAGWALAERLQFLSTQEREWCNDNKGFEKRQMQFGDRRHARAPLSYLGWLAGDYLRKLVSERRQAALLLAPVHDGKSTAELAGYSKKRKDRLKWLLKLDDFSPESATDWGEAVFKEMEAHEEIILNSPQMRTRISRDSRERRKSGEVRLYDFKPTIVRAVGRLAAKPPGQIRGITRPR